MVADIAIAPEANVLSPYKDILIALDGSYAFSITGQSLFLIQMEML